MIVSVSRKCYGEEIVTYHKLGVVGEIHLTHEVALGAKVVVITCREFVMSYTSVHSSAEYHVRSVSQWEAEGDVLLVPSLFKYTPNTLDPLVNFSSFVPVFPRIRHPSDTVFAQSEPGGDAWVYGLFAGDKLLWVELNALAALSRVGEDVFCVGVYKLGYRRGGKA